MTKKIIHVDMDAYYAAIEQRDNPDLRGKPVIVGGPPDTRSVVSTASYEARKYGIHSAMPVKRALALCRNAIIVPPDFQKYKSVSKILYSMFREYTDLVESVSLDECYLDVTENKKGIPIATDIAVEIKSRIRSELNLTASAGVAPNMLLAKIASDINKPDGLFVIKPHQVDVFMKNLDVKKLWGVGRVTLSRLHALGIHTCKELQKISMEELKKNFGKYGETLYEFSRGMDGRQVTPVREIKSIGSETTLPHDSQNLDELKRILREQAEYVTERMKRKNMKGRTITLKIKYSDFQQITRSRTIDENTDDFLKIYAIAETLMEKTEAGTRPVRLVGASVSNFDMEAQENDTLLFD